MVPNVYGMSQYADGGLITTKPYVSGSNYLRKMTRYPKGDWCEIWDGLYWRFIEKHRPLFESNPRLAMMTSHLDRMGEERLGAHKDRAADFLARLHAADRTEFL
jgi:deoxyribodipyrimidine photolyase-related protein